MPKTNKDNNDLIKKKILKIEAQKEKVRQECSNKLNVLNKKLEEIQTLCLHAQVEYKYGVPASYAICKICKKELI